MKQDLGLGNSRTIPGYVREKLAALNAAEPGFDRFFALLFREEKNVMYERSRGFRVETFTYRTVRDRILCRARALKEALSSLVPEGGAVGLYMENSLEWIECFWAILAAGRNPLLLNLRLEDAILEKALRDTGAGAVISRGKTFSVPSVFVDGIPFEGEPIRDPRFGTEVLVMSSGTGGSVKIASYGAGEFSRQIEGSAEIIRICPAARTHVNGSLKLLTFLPFYHVFGLTAVYLWFAFFSRTFVELKDLAPQTVLNTIRRHGVTHIFAVPLFWETVYREAMKAVAARGEKTEKKFQKGLRLIRRLDFAPALRDALARRLFREVRENLFGESVHFMISGGSSLREEVLAFFNGIGYPLVEGYGMTEIGITSVELSDRLSVRCSGSVGRPMKNVRYRADGSGELWVSGSVAARWVMENGKKTPRPEWFPTRDLARCEKGHWYVLGRRDDVIVSADGENLNPNLYEPGLIGDGVREACLIGVREDGVITPVLLLAVSPFLSGEEWKKTDLAVREKLEKAGLSGRVRRIAYFSGSLLKGDEFKLNRRRLSREWEEGLLTPIDPAAKDAGSADSALSEALACFAAALGTAPDRIAPEADFFLDLGGTSLDYFAMNAKIKEELGTDLSAGPGASVTAASLAALIRQRRS